MIPESLLICQFVSKDIKIRSVSPAITTIRLSVARENSGTTQRYALVFISKPLQSVWCEIQPCIFSESRPLEAVFGNVPERNTVSLAGQSKNKQGGWCVTFAEIK